MKNPFTVFRRCRELEAKNEELNSSIKKLTAELSEITAMRADYPGIEPCRSQRCLKCEYSLARARYDADGKEQIQLIGCVFNARCDDFKLSKFYWSD